MRALHTLSAAKCSLFLVIFSKCLIIHELQDTVLDTAAQPTGNTANPSTANL